METIKEFFDAIKGQLTERLANPFTGAFCIAWAAWNFRLLMVLFGKGTYQEKFLYIDTSLYLDWRYWLLRGVMLPIATATVYLLAYPWATRWLAEHYRKQQTKANNLIKAADGAALLSVEDSRKLRTKYAEAEQAWQSERDRLVAEIDAAKETAARLAKTNAELRDEAVRSKASAFPTQTSESEGATADGLVATFEAGLGNVDEQPNKGGIGESIDRPLLKMGPEASMQLPREVSATSYSRRQLQVLSVLREGLQLTPDDLVAKLKGDKFQVHRAIDRLRELNLLAVNRTTRAVYLTPAGRSLLGAFVDEGQWQFAKEGF
ncbi:helix-turn-helix domain-containing protein [Variovorax sp.]|uniref:MarR family transcriptional regulator n=1 Tax=Variovorax sp. TaxID=1871043 RepID=UPI0025D8B111|nr:helix-turn-helix domain-containing protein [Variovorax sp.]